MKGAESCLPSPGLHMAAGDSWWHHKAHAGHAVFVNTHGTIVPLFLLADFPPLFLSLPPAAFNHRAAERESHTRGANAVQEEVSDLLAVLFWLKHSEGCLPTKLDIDFFLLFATGFDLPRKLVFIHQLDFTGHLFPPSSFFLAPPFFSQADLHNIISCV